VIDAVLQGERVMTYLMQNPHKAMGVLQTMMDAWGQVSFLCLFPTLPILARLASAARCCFEPFDRC
jgi:hypothetical protein